MATEKRNCKWCNSSFQPENSEINRGRGNYCSRKCVCEMNKENRKVEKRVFNCLYCNKSFLERLTRNSNIYCSQECYWEDRRQQNRPDLEEENHSCWIGDKVGYNALHSWVKKHLGYPDVCEHCKKNGLSGRQIHWANKDHEYKRILEDWLRLCAKCHSSYDRGRGIR